MSDGTDEQTPQENENSTDTRNENPARQAILDAAEKAKTTGTQTPSTSVPDYSELLGAIQAMPENIVNAIREAFPAPAKPKPQPQKETEVVKSTVNTNAKKETKSEESPGGKRSFADRWFN